MYKFYRWLTHAAKPHLLKLLDKRVALGKEDPERLNERKGTASTKRPEGQVFWLHAASVGEVQSAQILIRRLLQDHNDLHILVSTGTLTSAQMMSKNLPERAFHQFYPLDHPEWCENFLDHWQPNLIFWMESELWPNMLEGIQRRNIPSILLNARLSPRSYRKWRLVRPLICKLLGTFSLILCQTLEDEKLYKNLGGKNVKTSGNLKYSAAPLPFNKNALTSFTTALLQRPLWLYASTHKGEEDIAAAVHRKLKIEFPDILSVIVPRHPERRDAIKETLITSGLDITFRNSPDGVQLPHPETDIYIADTLGELGLFYRACPIAMIGRSLSDDGGGGHNPIEAAQLNCSVLHGPHIQNLQEIFDEMDAEKAAISVQDTEDLTHHVKMLLADTSMLNTMQSKAAAFAKKKNTVLEHVIQHITPYIDQS